MFKKILIANRGEIAVRVMRACREMDIQTVAVYSEIDRHALHVRVANEAVAIGPAPAQESYLDIDKVVQAAVKSRAEAIHPGYGFLSENAAFARAVREAGLVFIGPPSEAIEAMGDKGRARDRMIAAGVPVVPGYQGADDDASLQAAGLKIGFPLLVKAAAGGGGKGMRVVDGPEGMLEAFGAARREGLHSFGDERLILERYIPHARHIEFQVLADAAWPRHSPVRTGMLGAAAPSKDHRGNAFRAGGRGHARAYGRCRGGRGPGGGIHQCRHH